MSQYTRLCTSITDIGKYVPKDDDIHKHVKDHNKDAYYSIYSYTKEQVELAKEMIEVEKNGKKYTRPRGISGITEVVTDRLVFDFDSTDVQLAQKDTIKVVDRLLKNGLQENDIRTWFSGNKGFAIEVHYSNGTLDPKEFKAITKSLAGDLSTYDSVVSNPSRIFRLPNTKHPKSGLFKTPLTLDELRGMSIEEIREASSGEYEDEVSQHWSVSDLLPKFKTLATVEEPSTPKVTGEVGEYDPSKNPLNLDSWKNALLQGFFPDGQRSNALMILCATLKEKGYDKKLSYYSLKAAADKQSDRYGGEKFEKEEIWLNIIEQVYEGLWNGGTYSQENFPESLIKYYETELNLPRRSDELALELVMNVSEGLKGFDFYAENADKNTFKFGIADLDKSLKVMKGHLIGVLAPPSVGKTSLALTVLNNTSKDGKKSFFGSYDMYSNTVFQKLIQREFGVDQEYIFSAYRDNDTELIAEFHEVLKQNYSNVTFCFKTGQSVEELKQSVHAAEEKSGENIELVVVDYLELIRTKSTDPTQASAEAIQGLREIANEGRVVIVLLQPNKMSSTIDEPLLSYNCAKGSSSIAQACTSIITAHRPGMSSLEPENDKYFGVNVVKNRMGSLSSCYFNWDGLTGRIGQMVDSQKKELDAFLESKRRTKAIDALD